MELDLVKNLMHFDQLLPTDAQLTLSQVAYSEALGLGDGSGAVNNKAGGEPHQGGSRQ